MKQLFISALILLSISARSQVGISTTNTLPHTSSMLDVSSTNRGMLIPRMNTTERVTNIASPANGLLVYDITTSSFWVFKSGTGWVEIVSFNLPFSATVNTVNSFPDAALSIINSNTVAGSAATFQISSATNSGSALSATTSGTGNAFRAEVSGGTAANAVFGRATGSSMGSAGSFVNDNAANTNVAVGIFNNATNSNAHSLTVSTTGGGDAGKFVVSNSSNTSNALEVRSNGALASRAVLVNHSGFGVAADIQISNTSNVNAVLAINHLGKGRGALIQSTNPANKATVLDVFTAGTGRAFASTHGGTAGSAGVFMNSNSSNISSALDVSTVGDAYAATFANSLNTATNSGAIRAFSDASSGTGFPNVILAQANGTLGTAGFFYSVNPNNVRPTMVVRNDGLERVLIVSATNTANAADALTTTMDGTGAAIVASNTNANGTGSAGIFQKSFARTGSYTGSPTCEIEVRHPVAVTNGLTGLRIFNEGGNRNAWTLYTQNTTGNLLMITNGTIVGNFNQGTGAYTTTSDARLKSAISAMPDLLLNVMKLKPKTYYYTSDSRRKMQLGFLAQDIEPLFPEAVYKNKSDKGDETYTMDYSAFGVIAVKAVQEQQRIIEGQQNEIDELKKEIAAIKVIMRKQ